MSEQRYDIFFAGECLPGHDASAVRAGLAKLFKADDATLDRLFAGKAQRIKRDADQTMAAKYEKAMAAIGAKAIVRAVVSEASTFVTAPASVVAGPAAAPNFAPASTQTSPSNKPSSANTASLEANAKDATNTLSLADPGSEVLYDHERTQVHAENIPTDHMALAEAGSRLTPESPAVVPSTQAPDFEIAPEGTDIAAQRHDVPPSVPNTENLSLTEEGTDFSDCARAPAAPPNLNIDGLTVASSGSDILTDAERATDATAAPDTSHLSLEPDSQP